MNEWLRNPITLTQFLIIERLSRITIKETEKKKQNTLRLTSDFFKYTCLYRTQKVKTVLEQSSSSTN